MALPKINPTKTEAWKELSQHFEELKTVKMRDLFSEDHSRADTLSIEWNDFYLDYSKNRITDNTMSLLIKLANETGLKESIESLFKGEKINETEDRAALHTALRDFDSMRPEVKLTLQKMELFSEDIINGTKKGYTNKSISHIVNIGIGGSSLGPEMVNKALSYYKNHLEIRYISNVDGDHLTESIKDLDRETTLFIVVSKTFTTLETITNATAIREWFLEEASEADIAKHFVGVTDNSNLAGQFGIDANYIFPIWDWVGGRFSLWSAAGLSICCGVGYKNFESLLKGAHEMDEHFKSEPFEKNIPVIMALISIWYNNFFKTESEAVIPYSEYLSNFVDYLQQAVMESNGKSTDRNGHSVDYQTSSILWGNTGTNAQHAFFQLLHQGTKLVPVDFICFSESLHMKTDSQSKLLASCFAQSEALLLGTEGNNGHLQNESFEGNKPSNTLLIKKLNPKNLGSLIATYEHKIFVQGVIWNIFSFDQWGVELGKNLTKNTLEAIDQNDTNNISNASTKNLLNSLNTK